jgi:hypothetical protein
MTTTSDASSGNTARYGWRYSLFAGIVAFPIAAGVTLLFGRGVINWPLVAFLTVTAIAAARLGGWLALAWGGRDHGIRAAAFTGIVYAFLCGILFEGALAFYLLFEPSLQQLSAHERWQLVLHDGLPSFVRDFVGGVIFSTLLVAAAFGWLILLACVGGTIAFHRLMRIESSPRGGGAYDRELRR